MAFSSLNLKPTPRELRQFAVICLVGLALVGVVLRWRFGLHTAPVVLAVLAPLIAGAGLAAPQAVRPLYVALVIVTYPIGWVISHLVLALTFYVVFAGIGLIFRLLGRDVLGRRFDPSAATYWVRRRPVTDVRRYFRQS